MSLPHILLGLLSEEPRTGYDLERAMREDLDSIWRAKFSQIYPVLARLRRAGHVHLKVLGPRGGPRRNLYRVTAAGRREFRSWLAAPLPQQGKDPLLARVAFLDVLPPGDQRAALFALDRSLGEEVRRLRSSSAPAGSRLQARRGAIDRLEAGRRWLQALARESAGGPPAIPAKKK
jgi:DNA-binding PadR family transcriptional regulator